MDFNPCAVCKFMKVECSTACVFLPYFPSTEPEKFDRVHRVFGVENVYKILARLTTPSQRHNAVNALCYEAEARILDPIHGYVGISSVYENRLNILKEEIDSAKNEIVTTMGPDEVPQNQEMGDGRENAGASTSAGPSVVLGSTGDTQ